jgi:glycerophosphoryl diester phosphodiesterase
MTLPTLPIRPPIVVHHMAALDGQCAPNSLEAIRASLEADAAFIEVDVTALAEGDYLLVHDPVLESETTGVGAVGACTVAQARDLFYKPYNATNGDRRFHVPVLGDVVKTFLDYGGSARLQLDFKNMIPMPSEEPLIRLIRLIEPLGERVIVSTGADWQLRKLRALAPWLDLGFDIQFYLDWREPGQASHPDAYPQQFGAYGYWDDHPLATQRIWTTAEYLADKCGMLVGLVPRVSTFYIDHKLLVQSLDDGFNWADALHNAGIKLDAWTLDIGDPVAEANARRLFAAGVDQFTTNTPLAMASFLAHL